jgi:predicted RNA-binding Zn-ribbon protein involved in translation (DUF1610 family)
MKKRKSKASTAKYVETPEQRRLIQDAWVAYEGGRISLVEHGRRMKRIEKGLSPNPEIYREPVIDPKCPRCGEVLAKLVAPRGSRYPWVHTEGREDFRCSNCVKLQEAGRLSWKARTAWYASFFRKQAK